MFLQSTIFNFSNYILLKKDVLFYDIYTDKKL